MSGAMDQASRLISAVQIAGVRLVDVTARSQIRSVADAEAVDIKIDRNAWVQDEPRDSVLYVLASIELRVVAEGRTAPVVGVKATYELKYTLPEDFGGVGSEELEAFARVNAVFNAWPYWREFIQSTLTRMDLPPLTLPVFRLTDQLVAIEAEDKDMRALT